MTRHDLSLQERFDQKWVVDSVEIQPYPDRPFYGTACHRWIASFKGNEYGQMIVNKENKGAHCISYFLRHGVWPDPCCLHYCDHPWCVNPDHLFEGSYFDNTHDMLDKGRAKFNLENAHRINQENGYLIQRRCAEIANQKQRENSKFSEQDIREIRNPRYSFLANKELAEVFDVSRKMISSIRHRKSWRM